MQFEVTAGQRLETDAIGGIQVAISGKIGSPRGQRADELHAGQAAQLIAQASRGAAYQSADRCLSLGRPETGVYPLTSGVEALGLAISGKSLFDRLETELHSQRNR